MASGRSSLTQSTMSWPWVRSAPSEPCQVSPPSSMSTRSGPPSARPARGAPRVDQGGGGVEPADAAIVFGERGEILRRERVGRGRAWRNAESLQERSAGEMRRLAPHVARADVYRRLAKIDRHE